jgi:uncharacterized protein (TIGR02996 family)
MENDEAFLRAIADSPSDSRIRLEYADWLDKRGDSRAEFLRIQSPLGKPPPRGATYREYCEREQYLVKQLAPSWVQRVRRFTTPAPCRDLPVLVPELNPFARITTRLHPHRAETPLPVSASKLGGRFLWPTNEPWPSCTTCDGVLAPVLQLRAKDVADVAFPAETDLLQLFWCPNEAAHNYLLAPRIWWRNSAAITFSRTDDPDLSAFPRKSDWEGLVPLECCVYPEPVIEYPVGDDLYALAGTEQATRIGKLLDKLQISSAEDLVERFASAHGPKNARELVYSELGQCPGSKVGGKPSFVEDGRRFDHLVTLSTWEFDSASFRRWLAVEDQRLLALPAEPLTWVRLFRESGFGSFQEVIGMQLGRTQRAHVYVCRDRDPWEVIGFIND